MATTGTGQETGSAGSLLTVTTLEMDVGTAAGRAETESVTLFGAIDIVSANIIAGR
jgi:hypothetical protein